MLKNKMSDTAIKKSLTTQNNRVTRFLSSRSSLIILLIIIIGIFQTAFMKTQIHLSQGGDYNLVNAIFSNDGLFNLTVTAVVVGIHLIVSEILKRILSNGSVKLRYALQFIISGILAAAGASLCIWFYYTVLFNLSPPTASVVFNIAVLAFIIPIVLTGLLETFYYHGEWQKELYAQEQIKRQMVAAKFEALKNQLSPHFVFNSFNTLAAIIENDPQMAQGFLKQLSKVYRYILDNKDKETVPLSLEIESVTALLNVQETRHPGAIKINIDINAGEKKLPVIPLTLHTLVENTFKHNNLSSENPITLSIKVHQSKQLIIENQIRPKLDVESHNIGIENLSHRYQLLRKTGLNIIKNSRTFRVEIPLVTSEDNIQ